MELVLLRCVPAVLAVLLLGAATATRAAAYPPVRAPVSTPAPPAVLPALPSPSPTLPVAAPSLPALLPSPAPSASAAAPAASPSAGAQGTPSPNPGAPPGATAAAPGQPAGAGPAVRAAPAAAAGPLPAAAAPAIPFPALVEHVLDSPLGPAPPVAGLALLALSAALALRRRLRQLERDRTLEAAKVGFLKVASHELRTPLTVIRGYVDMAADGSLGELPPRLRHALPTLGAEVRQLERLVEQMLLAARLDEDLLVLDRRRADLRELVERCLEAMPDATDHRFVLELDRARVPVNVDAQALGEILGNLVDNAVKYSPAGGEVRIGVERAWRGARLRVTDSGLGIGAADVPLLFTRFGRILTPENSHIFGSGLGLYLVRELARRHGGQVRVTSVPGQGSTFTVELPLDLPIWSRALPARRGGREARANPAAG